MVWLLAIPVVFLWWLKSLKTARQLDRLERLMLFEPTGPSGLSQNDITVMIAVRDRLDYRLENALQSIRTQSYDQSLIQILLVDYSSQEELIPNYQKLCETFKALYLRIDGQPFFRKGDCLNQGLLQVKTKFLLICDVDIIFENNYIETAVQRMQKSCNQIIMSRMLDLPEGAVNSVVNVLEEYPKLKQIATQRGVKFSRYLYGKAMCMSFTRYFRLVGGYDDTFALWGFEDDDLFQRFREIGLKTTCISDATSYLHQWHPKYEGVSNHPDFQKKMSENKAKYKKRWVRKGFWSR
ncbi:glycosyltransferase [bacterium]|nr:glycosyltransferase [bacterium]